MRKIIVKRAWKLAGYTIGKLYVDNVYWCNVLEDTDRGLRQTMTEAQIAARKVYGQTAIPTGVYRCRLNTSGKFSSRSWAKPYGGLLPEVLDVPGFSGIRIHPGNTAEDTLGCLLPGENTVRGKVTNSTYWFRRLMDDVFMPARISREEITLEIY